MMLLARALAVLATVTFLASGAAAVAVYVTGDPATYPPVELGQTVTGRPHGATFAVPASASGWTVRPPDEVIYYADAAGEPVIGVSGPAVYDAGYCDAAPGASNRAFVGFTRTVADPSVEAVNHQLTAELVSGISTLPHRVPVTTRAVSLADGPPAVRSSAVVRLPEPGPCEPSRVRLDLVSFGRGERVVSFALVRDLGSDALPDEVAERILQSLRSRT